MKIAISLTNQDIKSDVSNIFGRCLYFVVIEMINDKVIETKIIKNKSVNQNSSAGIATVQLLIDNNINSVITGNVGPKALEVLKQFNIDVYFGLGNVEDVLQSFIDKKLKKIS